MNFPKKKNNGYLSQFFFYMYIVASDAVRALLGSNVSHTSMLLVTMLTIPENYSKQAKNEKC